MPRSRYELETLFVRWFEQSAVDFWDESDAPAELAEIAFKFFSSLEEVREKRE